MISPIRDPNHSLVPPLRDGDRLSLEEFERRWEATPDLKRAELIEGQVYMNAASLRWDWHAEPHGLVVHVMNSYSFATPGVRCGLEPSFRMEPNSMPQPDAVLRVHEDWGGQSRLARGYLIGSPEFLVEISASTEKHDLETKKDLYQQAKVQEYFVWSVLDEKIISFSLSGEEYLEVVPDASGVLKSSVLPGLWFDTAALIHGDRDRIADVLRAGLQSPEHEQFVAKLKARHVQGGGQT